MLKAIHASKDGDAAKDKAQAVIKKLAAQKHNQAAKKVKESIDETSTYCESSKEQKEAYRFFHNPSRPTHDPAKNHCGLTGKDKIYTSSFDDPGPASGRKHFLLAPQTGQHQSAGASSNFVPLATLPLRSPLSGS
jgi:hypothetical protein